MPARADLAILGAILERQGGRPIVGGWTGRYRASKGATAVERQGERDGCQRTVGTKSLCSRRSDAERVPVGQQHAGGWHPGNRAVCRRNRPIGVVGAAPEPGYVDGSLGVELVGEGSGGRRLTGIGFPVPATIIALNQRHHGERVVQRMVVAIVGDDRGELGLRRPAEDAVLNRRP